MVIEGLSDGDRRSSQVALIQSASNIYNITSTLSVIEGLSDGRDSKCLLPCRLQASCTPCIRHCTLLSVPCLPLQRHGKSPAGRPLAKCDMHTVSVYPASAPPRPASACSLPPSLPPSHSGRHLAKKRRRARARSRARALSRAHAHRGG